MYGLKDPLKLLRDQSELRRADARAAQANEDASLRGSLMPPGLQWYDHDSARAVPSGSGSNEIVGGNDVFSEEEIDYESDDDDELGLGFDGVLYDSDRGLSI
jgi:hypothetical protein